ncbi:MAG: hypothetical protein RL757_1927 [Bacteroidota bacterium]|jgi:hypothetical protein
MPPPVSDRFLLEKLVFLKSFFISFEANGG